MRRLDRVRGEYITPGPNYVWSIDAHCKLEHWGFQIYAAIDAFSRYIVWSHCSISSRTGASVSKQYVNAVAANNVQPELLRADHGTETLIIADMHFQMGQAVRQDLYNPETGETFSGEALSFARAFLFGTSVANQRIEAWWQQVTRGQLLRWRVSHPYSI